MLSANVANPDFDDQNWGEEIVRWREITGIGVRTVESRNGARNSAASLEIEYTFDDTEPTVARLSASPVSGDLPLDVSFDASVSSDDAGISMYEWAFGDGQFLLNGPFNPTHTYTSAGVFTTMVSVTDDAGRSGEAEIQINVTDPNAPPEPRTAVYVIANGSNDVEERPDLSKDINSSDIELIRASSNDQTVGLRFVNIAIPPGARIDNASLQFTADETSSSQTDLSIAIQAIGNAAPFTSESGNVTSRSNGPVPVTRSPAAWTTVGESGPAQQSPSLQALVQEVVDRADWASGNAIAFIISGTGKRTAESYEGDQNGAAALTIECTTTQ